MTWNLAQAMNMIKAAGHKYTHRKMVGRDPKTGRKRYRYYYAEHHGGGITGAAFEAGAAFKLTFKGRRGHFHVQRVEGDKVFVKHDGRPGSKEVEMSQDELRALLKRQHSKAETKSREKAQANRRKKKKSPKKSAKKSAKKKTPREEPLKERLDPIEMKKMRGNLSFLRGQLEAMDINEKGQVKDPWARDRADPMYYQEPTPKQKQTIDDYKRTIDEIERRTQPQGYEKPSGLEAFKVALIPYVKGLKDITTGRGPRGNPVVTLVVGGGDREAFVARLKETYLGDGNRTYTISGPNNADFNVYLRDGEEALENIYLNLLNHQTTVSETEERPREKAAKKAAKKKATKKSTKKKTPREEMVETAPPEAQPTEPEPTTPPTPQRSQTAQAFSGMVDAIKSGSKGTEAQASQRAFKAELDKVIDKTESGTLTDAERAELLPIAEQLVEVTSGRARNLMTAVRDQLKGSSEGGETLTPSAEYKQTRAEILKETYGDFDRKKIKELEQRLKAQQGPDSEQASETHISSMLALTKTPEMRRLIDNVVANHKGTSPPRQQLDAITQYIAEQAPTRAPQPEDQSLESLEYEVKKVRERATADLERVGGDKIAPPIIAELNAQRDAAYNAIPSEQGDERRKAQEEYYKRDALAMATRHVYSTAINSAIQERTSRQIQELEQLIFDKKRERAEERARAREAKR